MSASLYRWFRTLAVVFALSLWGSAAVSENLPPASEGPTLVDLSIYIEDVSGVNLGTETYEVTARLELAWRDPRLAFNPATTGGSERQVWVGEQARRKLASIWYPLVEFSGEKGLRAVDVHALVIHRDGTVELHEKFHAEPRFDGELHAYPFGKLDLAVTLSSVALSSDQLVLNLRHVSPTGLEALDEVTQGNWLPVDIQWGKRLVDHPTLEGSKFSQVYVHITVEHDFIDGLHKIFLPLFVIGIVSSAMLFINFMVQPAFSSPRIAGLTTLILTTIALKFVLGRELPQLHYATLTDALFNLTIIMLSIGLVLSCVVSASFTASKHHLARRLHYVTSRLYPFIYLLATILIFLVYR